MILKCDIITNYMNEHNLTEEDMAKKCDVKLCYLKRLIKGDATVRMDYFIKVVEVIGCSCDDFV